MNLRNNDDYDVPFARLVSLERQPFTKLPKLWIEFENENIKIIRNKLEFNKKLKSFLLNQLIQHHNLQQIILSTVPSS